MDIDKLIDAVEFQTRHSNKTGKNYECVVITLTNGLELLVFPHPLIKNWIKEQVTSEK